MRSARQISKLEKASLVRLIAVVTVTVKDLSDRFIIVLLLDFDVRGLQVKRRRAEDLLVNLSKHRLVNIYLLYHLCLLVHLPRPTDLKQVLRLAALEL